MITASELRAVARAEFDTLRFAVILDADDRFERVRRELAEARIEGRPFSDAWAAALRAVDHRTRAIFRATAPAWARAYEHVTPSPAEHAVLGVIDGLRDDEPDGYPIVGLRVA